LLCIISAFYGNSFVDINEYLLSNGRRICHLKLVIWN
jgi:hypothetical protein